MFNRLYETIKKIIKENYKSVLLFVFCYLVLMWPVDYYITTGGGTIDINNRVKITNAYNSKGSLHLAYVSELQGNVATYLLSYIIPDWQRTNVDLYKVDEEEDRESIDFRNHLDLNESIDSAIKVAYNKAGKTFQIEKEHIYITYVSKNSKTALQVGDEIILVAGKHIADLDDLRAIIENYQLGDKVSFTIIRNGKQKQIEAEVLEEDNRKIIGISVGKSYEYKTNPKINLSFKKSESGPSGGMMLCLDIYNKLTKKDITKGYKIVGTGTISDDGSIGEIGGVQYKLMGAVKNNADIFLVPAGDNYKEAVKYAKKKKYSIKIIAAKNIDGVLTSLDKLPKKN